MEFLIIHRTQNSGKLGLTIVEADSQVPAIIAVASSLDKSDDVVELEAIDLSEIPKIEMKDLRGKS